MKIESELRRKDFENTEKDNDTEKQKEKRRRGRIQKRSR